MSHFIVTERPLSLQAVVDAVSTPGHGGIATFSGAVRNLTSGKAVLELEYEAYAPMAVRQLALIAKEVQSRWPGVKTAIEHRIGTLRPGDVAVVIATSAPHRAEAFAACQYVIERLKQSVPIWKKEKFADGTHWVGLGP